MSGLQEMSSMRQRLDATFERINILDSNDFELRLRSDFAQYLCILVSGYIETAVASILQEHARQNGSPSLQRFVEFKTKRFSNANSQKITDLLGSFDGTWRSDFEKFLTEDLKAAINNIVRHRHQIAHGQESQITYNVVYECYQKTLVVLDKVKQLCLDDRID